MNHISHLPSLPLSERPMLPDVAAVYLAIAKDGSVLYIGRARRLNARWQRHHRYKQLKAIDGVRLAWVVVDDEDELSAIELDYIQRYNPAINSSRIPADQNRMKVLPLYFPAALAAKMESIALRISVKRGRRVSFAELAREACEAALDKFEADHPDIFEKDWIALAREQKEAA